MMSRSRSPQASPLNAHTTSSSTASSAVVATDALQNVSDFQMRRWYLHAERQFARVLQANADDAIALYNRAHALLMAEVVLVLPMANAALTTSQNVVITSSAETASFDDTKRSSTGLLAPPLATSSSILEGLLTLPRVRTMC
jgi:hypothetical protein